MWWASIVLATMPPAESDPTRTEEYAFARKPDACDYTRVDLTATTTHISVIVSAVVDARQLDNGFKCVVSPPPSPTWSNFAIGRRPC